MKCAKLAALGISLLNLALFLPANGESAPTPGTGTGLLGQYTDQTEARITRVDATVNFFWLNGGPAPQLLSDYFAVEWNGLIQPQFSETYTFYTTSDDGVQLFINDQLVIDNYTDHALTENAGAITLQAGVKYRIQLRYYEAAGGAAIRLSWSSPSTPKQVVPQSQLYPAAQGGGAGLFAQYFNSMDLSGTNVTRIDSVVDFDFGIGSPAAGIGVDHFSVRWTGWVQPRFTGPYTFETDSDDGVRLWVNNKLVINNWTDHGSTTDSSAPINLIAGKFYSIRMEFYEKGGAAVARLKWSHTNEPLAVIPTSQLYPANGFHDFAVTKITVPKRVTLSAANPVVTRRVSVTIQNRSPHSETIAGPREFNSLVSLEVRPVTNSACFVMPPELLTNAPQRTLPITLKPGERLNVYYNVTFDCAVDEATGTGHEDFSYIARVFYPATPGSFDIHLDCDVCPRGPAVGGVDPYPAGKTADKGCGTPAGGGTFGNQVLTDIFIKQRR